MRAMLDGQACLLAPHAAGMRRRSQCRLVQIGQAGIGGISNRPPIGNGYDPVVRARTRRRRGLRAEVPPVSGDQAEQLGLVADELRASADELAWRQVAVCRKFPSYDK